MINYNIAGYLIFAFVTAITPGPNNYLLFSYGKHYGLKESISLMSGIFLGFFVLLYISGYGIGELIMQSPTVALILKIISSIWLLYLAFFLSKLSTVSKVNSRSKMRIHHGFLMQFVNPKAWIMAISGASAFLPHLKNVHINVFVFAILYCLVGIPCMISWVKFGDVFSKLLKSEKSNHILGFVMFGLMLISILMIWIKQKPQ